MLWSSEVLVGRWAAASAIEFYRSRGDLILGFEGFDTDGSHLVPRLDYIADLSALATPETRAADRCADAALRVLSQWNPGPQFITFVVRRLGD